MARNRSVWNTLMHGLSVLSGGRGETTQKPFRRRTLKLERLEKRQLLAVLAVGVPDPFAAEAGNETGTFTVGVTDVTYGASYTGYYKFTGSTDDIVIEGATYAYTTAEGEVIYKSDFSGCTATSTAITITPINDARCEGNHSVSLVLDHLDGISACCDETFTISNPDPPATITIFDDDQWTIDLTGDGELEEADTDEPLVLDIARTGGMDIRYAIAVDFSLGGKAVRGTDYVLECGGEVITSNSVTIPANETHVNLLVRPVNDWVPEENKSLTVSLTSATSSGILDDTGACCMQFWGPGGSFAVDDDSASVTIWDDDWWSVKFERGAPSNSEPNAIERLPGVVQDYGYYRVTRYDADLTDEHRATDKNYEISYTFWTTGTATRTTDFTLSAIAATGEGDAYEPIANSPTHGGVVVQGAVSYDTWSSTIPRQMTEAYIRVEPAFDWLDEGEPGNRADAPSSDDEAAYGEYIDGSLVTASWSGKPSSYDAVVPTADGEKRVVIHDGGIIRIRTDSDNNGTIEAADDEEADDTTSVGRVFMVNTDDDNDNDVDDYWERPANFDTPANSTAWDEGTANSVTEANENDLAETSLYAWVDSLEPEDAASPVEVDVYASGSIDLVLWTEATKGRRLHYGADTNPADCRIDEETRLVTLTAAETLFEETIYVEANTYSSSRRPVSLTADVPSTGGSGSDTTYYTTLKIDALAMAFNYDVDDNSGGDGLNLRSSYTADTEHSAPEWKTGALTYPLTLPEDGLVEQNTVLYLAGQSVKVGGRIVVDTKYAGMAIKVKATVAGGAIGGLEEVTFIVDADGVLQPQGTATDETVNGIDDFTLFAATNATSSVVRSEDARFYWEVTYIGADVSNGNDTGSNEAVITDPIRMYTVLDTPQSPWDVSDDSAVDDKKQPWASVLAFACDWAEGAGAPGTAVAAITTNGYTSFGKSYSGLLTHTVGATCHLSNLLASSQVDCQDMSAVVQLFSQIVGVSGVEVRVIDGGYSGFVYQAIKPIGISTWGTGTWNFHQVAWYGGAVYSACEMLNESSPEQAVGMSMADYKSKLWSSGTWTEMTPFSITTFD